MTRVMRMLMAAVAILSLPAAERAQKDAELSKQIKDLQNFLESDEGKALDNHATLVADVKQLKSDLETAQKAVRDVQKSGLLLRGNSVMVSGREARLQMLKDHRAFASDETAKRFGAFVAYAAAGVRAAELPAVVRELRDDVIKAAGDFDPAVSAAGGALIPNEFRAELIRNVEAVGVLFTQARRVPLVTGGQTIFPKRTGGLTAYPTAAGADIQRSRATFSTVTLTPVKWAVLAGVPNELLRYPGMLADVGQFVGVEMVYAIAQALDDAMVNGDGGANYGGITGIANSATIGSAVAATNHDLGSEIDGTDVSNVIGALTVAYAMPRAQWNMSLSMLTALRALKTTTGAPLYERGGNGLPSTIDGFPFTIVPAMRTKAQVTASTLWGIFGDLAMSHYCGMVGNIQIDQSSEALFTADMTAIRGLVHVDIKEADANAVVKCVSAA